MSLSPGSIAVISWTQLLQILTALAAYLLKYKRSKIRTVKPKFSIREMESGIQQQHSTRYLQERNICQTTSAHSLNVLKVCHGVPDGVTTSP